jgi:hypothetical protein
MRFPEDSLRCNSITPSQNILKPALDKKIKSIKAEQIISLAEAMRDYVCEHAPKLAVLIAFREEKDEVCCLADLHERLREEAFCLFKRDLQMDFALGEHARILQTGHLTYSYQDIIEYAQSARIYDPGFQQAFGSKLSKAYQIILRLDIGETNGKSKLVFTIAEKDLDVQQQELIFFSKTTIEMP